MIIVIDTNVFVSGVIRPYSLLSEYRDVLRRPRFGFSSDAIENLLFQIQEEGVLVVAAPLKFHLPDPDRVIDVSSVDVLKKGLLNFSVVIMKNCGRLPMIERPQEAAEHYLTFLKGK
jgi:hypothetical protein